MKKSRKLLLGLGAAAVVAVAAAVIFMAGRLTATTIRLSRAEGTVDITDDAGRDTQTREGMNLYSGYEVETSRKSYAWIDLDSVKLIKLDQRSEVEITKQGGELELRLTSGGLFFQISEPLGDDETLEIRTSTMVVGIRGTCGWVQVEDKTHMEVYILEGKVSCTLRDPDSAEKASGTVSGGQMARLTIDSEGPEGERCRVETSVFTVEDVPDFVLEEMGKIPKGVPPEAVPFNGHFYLLYTRTMTWEDAEAFCEEMGGHLVSITSQEEQEFLERYLQGRRDHGIMIGLHRSVDENLEQWVTGERVRYTNWGTLNEPDNAYGTEPVGVISPRGDSGYIDGHYYTIEPFHWNDLSQNTYPFLCEWDG